MQLWVRFFLTMALTALSHAQPVGELQDSQSCSGGFVIRSYRDQVTGAGSFEILRDERLLYERHGQLFTIGSDGETGKKSLLVGPDLTTSGYPHVVVFENTLGSHCCITAYVFELRNEAKLLATVSGEHAPPVFRQTAPGEPWEIYISDWTYAYWPSSFATSPAPEVILRWNGFAYVTAPDRMAKPAPSPSELAAKARLIRRSAEWTRNTTNYARSNIPPELFQTALDLMYSGHEDLGWGFIHDAWYPGYPVDETLLDDLRKRREKSAHWWAIKYTVVTSQSKTPLESWRSSDRRSGDSRPSR
jgi:hypothetical protein